MAYDFSKLVKIDGRILMNKGRLVVQMKDDELELPTIGDIYEEYCDAEGYVLLAHKQNAEYIEFISVMAYKNDEHVYYKTNFAEPITNIIKLNNEIKFESEQDAEDFGNYTRPSIKITGSLDTNTKVITYTQNILDSDKQTVLNTDSRTFTFVSNAIINEKLEIDLNGYWSDGSYLVIITPESIKYHRIDRDHGDVNRNNMPLGPLYFEDMHGVFNTRFNIIERTEDTITFTETLEAQDEENPDELKDYTYTYKLKYNYISDYLEMINEEYSYLSSYYLEKIKPEAAIIHPIH